MGGSVTIKAKCDQIAFTIAARVAAKLFVVDFKVGHGTADLAPPAVSPEYVLAELLVILLIEPDRRLFRHSSIHAAQPRQEIAAESNGKRTVSYRKVEANRRNSRKTTGP